MGSHRVSFGIAGVLVLLCLCPCVTMAMDMFGMINTLYFKADTNMDYIITEPELNNVYQGFDSNGDHKVTHTEFTSLWKDLVQDSDEEASAYFFLADINDDGYITEDDVRPAYARFDIDGDGQVEAQEFNLKWQEIYRESSFGVMYLRSDTNHDDDLQATEYTRLFSSLANHTDGSVSKAEFQTAWSREKFGRAMDASALVQALDTDRDGTVTTLEVGAFMKNYDFNGNGNIEILEVVQLVKLLPPLTS